MTYPTPRILTTALILFALCGTSTHASMARPHRTAATDFEFTGFSPTGGLRGAGHRYHLSDLRGKVVVLDFWASWCGPCERSLRASNRLRNRYSDLIFPGVNDENAAVIQRTRRDLGLRFPTAFDVDDSISGLYGIRAMPTTVIIDRDGRVVETIEGLRLDGARAIAQAARG